MNDAEFSVASRASQVGHRVATLSDKDLLCMLESGPIYILDPEAVGDACKHFLERFPGTTMYAVKANPSPDVVAAISRRGIKHFDVASLSEAKALHRSFPNATLHLMNPVKSANHLSVCYRDFGIRTFATDSVEETDKIAKFTRGAPDLTCVVRFSVPDGSAAVSISGKFGAEPAYAAEICRRIQQNGQKVGLTFHVGGQCEDPAAYANAIETASTIASAAGTEIEFLDVGGGFPARFGNGPEWLSRYFNKIRSAINQRFPNRERMHVFCEPGRALVSDTVKVVSQVTLRRGKDLFLNEGYYGALSEMPMLLRRVPIVAYRNMSVLNAPLSRFSLFGPTCDNVDFLGDNYALPSEIQMGDFLQFNGLGAYSLGLRTNFNGFFSDQVIPRQNAPQFEVRNHG